MSTDNTLLLPELLYRVAKAFNVETALKLADKLGGREIKIPVKPFHAKSEMVLAVGPVVAEFIRKQMDLRESASGKLLVPLGPASTARKRTQQLRKMIEDGQSTKQIVTVMRCHQRTVEWNRQQMRERRDRRQLALFPPS